MFWKNVDGVWGLVDEINQSFPFRKLVKIELYVLKMIIPWCIVRETSLICRKTKRNKDWVFKQLQ